jgi:thymidylate synthase (FAD)
MRENVLDRGYVDLIESWGSEERIIEAARMSTARGFEGWEKDTKLLGYLYTHEHMTPFEMAGMVIEVKAPIFVFREWHRHRVPFSYNEMSARYTPLPDENYIPTAQHVMERAAAAAKSSNKQAQGSKEMLLAHAVWFVGTLESAYNAAQRAYEEALSMGVPKELARVCLPVGRYSKMRASSNLRGWLNFLRLRQAENAQWEIRQYANAVGQLVNELFPRTWSLFKGVKP